MKALIKSLITLAIGGSFAGTALAGPGDAYGSHVASIAKTRAEKKTESVSIALFRPGAKAKAEKTLIPSAK